MLLWADELPGTLLHYDFTTFMDGGLLEDLSGNGHHGSVSGDVFPVEEGDCRGLSFGGRDGMILPAREKGLRVSGAFSIFAKFRIDPKAAAEARQKSPLLFGTTDGLGVKRNYTIFFDHGFTLTLNVSNGFSGETIDIRDIADGKIHSVAYIIAPPLMMLYRDGECIERRNSMGIMPDKDNGEAPVVVGKWAHGTFPGDIFDLRLFNRMLSPRETKELSGLDMSDAKCAIDFNINHSDVRRSLDWDATFENFPENAKAVVLRIDGEICFKRNLKADENTASFAILEEETPTVTLGIGRHETAVELIDENDDVLYSSSKEFNVCEIDCPEKFSNNIGITTEVLPPWTPMSMEQTKEGISVSMWNRTYRYGNEPLSETIFSGAEMFTRPSALNIVINGRRNPLTANPAKVVSSEKHQVKVLQSSGDDSMELTALHTIEYDGFDHVVLTMTAKKDLTVDALDFLFPMVSKYCQGAIRTLTMIDSLDIPRNYAFTPLLQICDENRGVHYLSDSDEFWFPKNNVNAITIGDNRSYETLFAIHPIAVSTRMKKGESFVYEFALTGMPARPMTRSSWRNRFSGLLPYCCELESATLQYKDKSILDYSTDAGMKGFIVVKQGEAFAYPPIPGTAYGDGIAALMKEAHARNLVAFPYCASFLYSECAPEWNERRLYCKSPMRDWSAMGDFLEGETGRRQHAYATCNSRQYQDLMLYRVREAILKTDIDGVYLDTTTDSIQCMESVHPHCGYIGRDGLRHPTANGFQTREMMKRLHTLIWELKGEKGVIDLHGSFALNSPAVAWATSLFCGEALREPPNLQIYKAVTPFEFRLAYTGNNIGVTDDFLCYTTHCTFRACSAMSMVHGISTRPHTQEAIDEQAEIWKMRDDLGCDDAEFIPYWDKACPIKAKEDGVYVSCYKRQDGTLIAVVANLTENNTLVTLVSTQNGVKLPLPFELPSQDFKMIDLK
ncbi:MAG: LamG domain-containing protein [Lentisphaeria bacterium]|nr:LamG domain-containing protein [Lentisphaeria bacterium]